MTNRVASGPVLKDPRRGQNFGALLDETRSLRLDADPLHRSNHLLACGRVEPVRGTGPWSAGMISIEGMNLNVDDRHGRPPACSTNCGRSRRASIPRAAAELQAQQFGAETG